MLMLEIYAKAKYKHFAARERKRELFEKNPYTAASRSVHFQGDELHPRQKRHIEFTVNVQTLDPLFPPPLVSNRRLATFGW